MSNVLSDIVIDLSHWQMTPNFEEVKAFGIVAVIFKASQGEGYVDPTFVPRAKSATAAGLLVGAYHFLDGSNPILQAGHFLNVAEPVTPMLALDFEPNPGSQATATQAAGAAATVQARTGRSPLIYTGRYVLDAPNSTLSLCPLWLAEYGSNPVCPPGWSEFKLWQHTDGHVGSDPIPVPSIGPCDRSRFAGTVDDLIAWWGTPSAMA